MSDIGVMESLTAPRSSRLKVLVTGGTGFIGSHLVEALLERGDRVLVLDNFSTSRPDALAPHPALQVVQGTIADAATVRLAVQALEPDVVVHAAASYKAPEDWAEDVCTNVLGTAHVVKACVEGGVRRLVYLQTSLCYGPRHSEQPIGLQHPVTPEGGSYAITKTVGEQFVRLGGVDFVSFRLANIYGPRNLSGPLPAFYRRLLRGEPCVVSDTRRDMVYVDDLVRVILRGVDGRGTGIYHVSSGRDVAILDLYEMTCRALQIRPPAVSVRPPDADDVPSLLLDPSRTHADFDWQATTPLEVGVERTVAWYRDHGVRNTYTHLQARDFRTDESSAG